MDGFVGGLVYLLVAIGILVTIHELGHFLAARACGVKVLRFSIGFGPIIFKMTGRNGCEYALSAIPLGGYVKMEGENDLDEEQKELPKDSFKAQGVLKRAIIIFAGPFFNFLLAVLLFTLNNMHGVTIGYPVVGYVLPESSASAAGFKTYDKIISFDNKEVNSWKNIMIEIFDNMGHDKNIPVKVSENIGKGPVRELSINLKNVKLNRNDDPLQKAGFIPCFGKITNEVGAIVENSPAQKASIKVGDIITQINGVKIDSWNALRDIIESSEIRELEMVVERDGVKYLTTVQPVMQYDKLTQKMRPFVGVGATIEHIEGLSENIKYGFVDASLKAVDDCVDMSKLVLVSLYKLANGSISTENISGPIAIAKGAQESANIGLFFFLTFLAAISVNLGIFNLLPIPVLDGGQLMFIAYEAIRGKAPSIAVQKILTIMGLAILLSLMVFSVFNDVKGLSY